MDATLAEGIFKWWQGVLVLVVIGLLIFLKIYRGRQQ
jgi:hypothetical protein